MIMKRGISVDKLKLFGWASGIIFVIICVGLYISYNNRTVEVVDKTYLPAVENELATIKDKSSRMVKTGKHSYTKKFYFTLKFQDGYEKRVRVTRSEYYDNETKDTWKESHDNQLTVFYVEKDHSDNVQEVVIEQVKGEGESVKIGKTYVYKELKKSMRGN